MGRLLHPKQIRAWIRGRPDIVSPNELMAGLGARGVWRLEILRGSGFLPNPASVLSISAPVYLLSAALHSFLIGLGVYLGFVWQENLDSNAGANDSRDVFITSVVGIAVCYLVYFLSSAVQNDQDPETLVEVVTKSMERYIASISPQGAELPNDGEPKAEARKQSAHEMPADRFSIPGEDEDIEAGAASKERLPIDPIVSLTRPSTDDAFPGTAQSQPYFPKAAVTTSVTTSALPFDAQELTATTLTRRDTDVRPVERSSNHQLLITALQESARLRRESAKIDERIARYYELLLESQRMGEKMT